MVLFGIYDLLLPQSSTGELLIFRIYFDFNIAYVWNCLSVIPRIIWKPDNMDETIMDQSIVLLLLKVDIDQHFFFNIAYAGLYVQIVNYK